MRLRLFIFLRFLSLLMGFLFFHPLSVLAYEVDTHKLMNEFIATTTINGFSLGTHLKNRLGFPKGIGEKFQGKSAFNWISAGGKFEDEPVGVVPIDFVSSRYCSHFHNPITDKGFSGVLNSGVCAGASSALWAQKPKGKQSFFGSNYSWYDVRDYYFKALTEQKKEDRDKNFAETFRGVGQLMHLVQDLASPGHTRDDGHYFFNYEKWVENAQEAKGDPLPPESLIIKTSMANPWSPEMSILKKPSAFSWAPVPIANLFDTNQYIGGNNASDTVKLNMGLSEYTHANFFSEQTIFTFPDPDFKNTVLLNEQDSKGKSITYISKVGGGEKITHLARANVFYKYLPAIYKPLGLTINDDRVYSDYAAQLIPRAVGYSAGLLNYFFRGTLQVIPGYDNFTIKNIGDEKMESGTISIYYDDPTNGNRYLLRSYPLTAPLAPQATTTPIYFTAFPPAGVRPSRYTVVFQGKLGEEENAVIGAVLSRQIYYVSVRDDILKIYRMDIDGKNQTPVYDNQDATTFIGKVTVSPDGSQLVFSTYPGTSNDSYFDSTLYLLDLATGKMKELTKGTEPSFAPDGTRVAFTRAIGNQPPPIGQRQIFVYDLTMSAETQLTYSSSNSINNTMPAWAPDGTSIAVAGYPYIGHTAGSTCRKFWRYIYLINPSTGTPMGAISCRSDGLGDSPGAFENDSAPSWSGNGSEIIFLGYAFSIHGGALTTRLFKIGVGVAGSPIVTRLTDVDHSVYHPDWSRWFLDGGLIALNFRRGTDDYDIWLVDPNGAGYLVNLTDSNPRGDGISTFGWWSP